MAEPFTDRGHPPGRSTLKTLYPSLHYPAETCVVYRYVLPVMTAKAIQSPAGDPSSDTRTALRPCRARSCHDPPDPRRSPVRRYRRYSGVCRGRDCYLVIRSRTLRAVFPRLWSFTPVVRGRCVFVVPLFRRNRLVTRGCRTPSDAPGSWHRDRPCLDVRGGVGTQVLVGQSRSVTP